MAKQTFMARVKAYRKLHPRISQVDAMKKLAGTKIGVVRKAGGNRRGNSTGPSTVHTGTLTVSGKKKPVKKSITKNLRITTVGSSRKKTSSPISRGVAISKKINDLELLLKNTSGVDAKNKVKKLINAEHDKLDAITKNLKSA